MAMRSRLRVEAALDQAAARWTAKRSASLQMSGHQMPGGAAGQDGAAGPGEGAAEGPGEGAEWATFADVTACYRLLLGRPPDDEGSGHYRQRLSSGRLSVHDMVEEFLGSVEFARAHNLGRPADRRAHEVVEACEGFRIHVDPTDYAVGHTVARTRTYEPEVSATLRTVLGEGATFVDIGANIGWFSLLGASLVGAAGRVIAIEPNPRNVALLRRSAMDNGFDNIEVLAVALSEGPGAVALETDGSNGRIIPVDGPPPAPVEAEFVVASYPLDEVLASAGIGHVDVIKIDVEGAEPLVLRGGAATFTSSRPVLISEFFPLALDSSPWGSAQGYLNTLRAYGYRLSVIGLEGDRDDSEIMALAGAPDTDHVDLLARPAKRPVKKGT
jgi:FkbM family methyltransferase